MREKLRRYGKQIMIFVCSFVIIAGSVFSFSFESNASDSEPIDSLELALWLDEQEQMNAVSTMSIEDEDYTDGSLRVQQLVLDGTNYKQLFSNDWTNGVVSALHVDVEHFYHTETWYDSVSIFKNDKTKMFDEGSDLSVNISNIINCLYVDGVGQFNFDSSGIKEVKVIFRNVNDQNSRIPVEEFSATSRVHYDTQRGVYGISFDYPDLPFDVYYMAVEVYYDIDDVYGNVSQYFNTNAVTRWGGFQESVISLDEKKVDENNGLLKSIIEWLTNIRDNIVNLPGLIWNAIKSGFNWIVDGLSELGSSILDGLSSLGDFIIYEFLGFKPAEDAAPSVDPDDTLGSIEESEEILLPDTSESEESLNVELNSGFGVLIDIVDRFAQLDAGVFSMYLTMLTFGVIALVLGR